MISSAAACHSSGVGSVFQWPTHVSIASIRAGTLVNVPRRRRRSVSSLNHLSIRLSQELLVGVKLHEEIPNAGGSDYDCSKGAVRNLTRTLALELAPLRINVNNLAPGMVLTPFNQPAIDDPDLLEEQVQSIPFKRAAQPAEIARLAVFLASSDSDYVTGSSYYMDGGLMRNLGQGA